MPVTWMLPTAPPPVAVMPDVDVIPSVPPEAKVKAPPPVTTVPAAAICKVDPLLTVKLTVFVTVPPEV